MNSISVKKAEWTPFAVTHLSSFTLKPIKNEYVINAATVIMLLPWKGNCTEISLCLKHQCNASLNVTKWVQVNKKYFIDVFVCDVAAFSVAFTAIHSHPTANEMNVRKEAEAGKWTCCHMSRGSNIIRIYTFRIPNKTPWRIIFVIFFALFNEFYTLYRMVNFFV